VPVLDDAGGHIALWRVPEAGGAVQTETSHPASRLAVDRLGGPLMFCPESGANPPVAERADLTLDAERVDLLGGELGRLVGVDRDDRRSRGA